jgi:hypothetical protein
MRSISPTKYCERLGQNLGYHHHVLMHRRHRVLIKRALEHLETKYNCYIHFVSSNV